MYGFHFVAFGLLIAIIGVGCTGVNTFPLAARAGDTVTIPIGAADGMSRANTTIIFQSDSSPGELIDLTPNVRAVFNLYPDKRSRAFLKIKNQGDKIVESAGHGLWQTVLVIDLPDLPLGRGVFKVYTPATFPQNQVYSIPHVSDVDIAIDILPGEGGRDALSFFWNQTTVAHDLETLEAMPNAVVKPPVLQDNFTAQYGGMELIFEHNVISVARGGGPTPTSQLYVEPVKLSPVSFSQLDASWAGEGNMMKVLLLSSNGMSLAESRISITPRFGVFSTLPELISVRYFDMQGEQVSGPLASEYTVTMN